MQERRIFDRYLISIINVSITTGFLLYFIGLFRFNNKIIIELGIAILSWSIFLFLLYVIDKSKKYVIKNIFNFSFPNSLIVFDKYIQAAIILLILASLFLIIFIVSFFRLINGYNGLQMFNFFGL